MSRHLGSEKIKQIVNYWDTALLCSLDSSTSHADEDVAFLDNIIENRVLDSLLTSYAPRDSKRCLDIGAGYGRFTQTLSRLYEEVILLEAAPQIYRQLELKWSDNEHIKCVANTFEAFEDSEPYHLLLTSGLLYLYDDQMVHEFAAKCRNMLASCGLLVIRDFIAEPPITMPSTYVKGSYCYYRTRRFWHTCAEMTGFEVVDIRRSKPHLKLLRGSRMLKLLDLMRIKSWIRNDTIIRISETIGDWSLRGSSINTVFLILQPQISE